MTTLSHRAEAASPDETRGLLEELFVLRFPESDDDGPEWNEGDVKYDTFYDLLSIRTDEAYLAAALMCRPEGWFFDVPIRPSAFTASVTYTHPEKIERGTWRRIEAATPALALIAAIAKVIEHGQ